MMGGGGLLLHRSRPPLWPIMVLYIVNSVQAVQYVVKVFW